MSNPQTIAQLENLLNERKRDFDHEVTINPALSLTEKQTAWARFLADQQAAVAMLMQGYKHRDQIVKQLADRIDLHQQMTDVAKRGAA